MEIARFEREWRENYALWRVHLGLNVAFWRHQRGMKQTDLADALQVSQATISRIERAEVLVTYERVCAMATYLEIPPEYLVRPPPPGASA